MPSVPPQYIPRSISENEAIVSGVLSTGITLCTSSDAISPTPDPDLDDVEIVPVVTGDGIGVISSSPSAKSLHHPRPKLIALDEISLHSPSELLGTPFDVTPPRFEYPFPTPTSEVIENLSPISPLSSPPSPMARFSASYISAMPTITLLNPVPTSHRYHSSHLKLQASTKEPPMPPGLENRRLSNGKAFTLARPQTRARSSSHPAPQAGLQSNQKLHKGGPASAERPSLRPRDSASSNTA